MMKSVTNRLTIIILIIGIVISLIKFCIDNNRRFSSHKYTIGKILCTKWNKGGYYIDIQYFVNEKEFVFETSAEGRDDLKSDDIYYVEFYTKNPQNFKILFDNPVSKHITKAPPEGWDKLPE